MSENLQIKRIDLHPVANAEEHFTNKFELLYEKPVLILRRGQKFLMTIYFENRNFTSNEDSVRIIFSFGTMPNLVKKTKTSLILKNNYPEVEDSSLWSLNFKPSNEENNYYVELEVLSPPTIPVGIWNLKIEASNCNLTTEPTVFECTCDIYFLFNPWCSADLVYMEDKNMLAEYVLNDIGKIWVGPQESCRGREWIFGQFDSCVLPACMLMFERSGLQDSNRGDPIKIARIISKLVNSDDDKGILIARWDGQYSDGIPPAAWTGSIDILKQFLRTQKSVGYGQCWVFAGVVTTICRALGIPSRVVSNLVSAHVANGSMIVNKYYDKNNEIYSEDNIWNYHAWNDVWMARPDLKDFNGWQAINATPTEKSNGFNQCGPAPLEAIKQGLIDINYDVGFMLASVNADIIRWQEDASCDLGYSKISCNKYQIGRLILTKKLYTYDPNGDRDKEDITNDYKAKKGTKSDPKCMEHAIERSNTTTKIKHIPEGRIDKMTFSLDDIKRNIKIGEPFNIIVNITNNSNKKRNIEAVLSATSIFYTGVKAKEIIKKKESFLVEPNSTKTIKAEVHPEDYTNKLVEYALIKLHAICKEKETNSTWADEDDLQVERPAIEIQVPDDIKLKQNAIITLNLKNPFKRTLTNCIFNVAGQGLTENTIVPCDDIEPEKNVTAKVPITPSAVGNHKLIVTFTSVELVDIMGSIEIII